MSNPLSDEKDRKMGILRSWLQTAKKAGLDVDIKKLKGVFMNDYGVLPSLLAKYLIELESAGEIEIDKTTNMLKVL